MTLGGVPILPVVPGSAGEPGMKTVPVPVRERNARILQLDLLSRQGAEALARDIELRWARAGHPDVRCRILPQSGGRKVKEVTIHSVRSNLVNGLPPSARLAERVAEQVERKWDQEVRGGRRRVRSPGIDR